VAGPGLELGMVCGGTRRGYRGDTWATEIGPVILAPPRLITDECGEFRRHDGGMTLLGTAGGVAGAAFIADLSSLLGTAQVPSSIDSGGDSRHAHRLVLGRGRLREKVRSMGTTTP